MPKFLDYLTEAFDGIFNKTPVKVVEQKEVLNTDEDDGALVITSAGNFYGQYLDLEKLARTDEELINRYREASQEPEFDYAVSEIINELVVIDEDETPVKLDLDDIEDKELPEAVKKKIIVEFENILKLLDFNRRGYDILRQWYVDGRLFYHKIIDENDLKAGIKELRSVDPRKIRKIKEVVRKDDPNQGKDIITTEIEYYVFSNKPKTSLQSGMKIHPDRICYVHSGLKNPKTGLILSHLNKALKRYNQLQLLEESVIIYRFTRAPERLVFYVGTGNMPPKKQEAYVQNLMNKFKNKIVFDAETGIPKEDKRFATMLDNYWFPRSGTGDGTEVKTIGGTQLSNGMEDVNEFRKQFYLALNVPLGRLEPSTGFSLGRSAEISREEVKFARFCTRLRVRFSDLFDNLLTTQLILKGVVSFEEWEPIKDKVRYHYNIDTHFKELLDQEVLASRINLLREVNEFTPRFMNEQAMSYYSTKWVSRHILMQTEEDQDEMAKEIQEERDSIQKEIEKMGFDPNGGSQAQDQFGNDIPNPGPQNIQQAQDQAQQMQSDANNAEVKKDIAKENAKVMAKNQPTPAPKAKSKS